jgi:hypothetical protein
LCGQLVPAGIVAVDHLPSIPELDCIGQI